MIVAHRHHVRPRLVDLAVNDALEEQPVLARAHRPVVEIERDDVVGGDLGGRHAAGEPVALRVARIARADVAIGVEHAVVAQDPVGGDQIVDQLAAGVA